MAASLKSRWTTTETLEGRAGGWEGWPRSHLLRHGWIDMEAERHSQSVPPLCDYKFDAPQEQKSEFEYEVEHGRGLRDPFSGHSDCVLSHKHQQATDGIVSPGDHPTASGRSAFRGRLQSAEPLMTGESAPDLTPAPTDDGSLARCLIRLCCTTLRRRR